MLCIFWIIRKGLTWEYEWGERGSHKGREDLYEETPKVDCVLSSRPNKCNDNEPNERKGGRQREQKMMMMDISTRRMQKTRARLACKNSARTGDAHGRNQETLPCEFLAVKWKSGHGTNMPNSLSRHCVDSFFLFSSHVIMVRRYSSLLYSPHVLRTVVFLIHWFFVFFINGGGMEMLNFSSLCSTGRRCQAC